MTALQDVGAEMFPIAGSRPISAPAWVVAIFGMSVVLSGVAYFVWHARKRRANAGLAIVSSAKGR